MNIENQQRNPVLLIHGIDDTRAVFQKMAVHLVLQGWSVYSLDLVPNNGNVGLDKLAKQIADYVTATFAPEQCLDLVGFSMGGIVSRYYVQRLGGINRVQRFITISSPHHGTVAAYGLATSRSIISAICLTSSLESWVKTIISSRRLRNSGRK